MCDTGYTTRELVADLRELKAADTSDTDMLLAVPGLARRLVLARHNWLRPSMCIPGAKPGTAGVHALHEEPDHSLAIFVVTWLPGEETPPHDHGTWTVIAGIDGSETNHWWRRLDDGSVPGRARIERAGHQVIGSGSIVAMPGDAIHSVHNDSQGVSITLHLYGMNVDFTARRKFDPANGTTSPYRMGGTLAADAAA